MDDEQTYKEYVRYNLPLEFISKTYKLKQEPKNEEIVLHNQTVQDVFQQRRDQWSSETQRQFML